MQRRDMFGSLVAGAAAMVGLAQARAAEPDNSRRKVVYHLADLDKVKFVLGNVRNHYEGTHGNVDIALVVHGPALSAFQKASAPAPLASRFAGLLKQQMTPYACANTLKGMDIALADLFEGFISADAGGVVKIAELQGQGYLYIRP